MPDGILFLLVRNEKNRTLTAYRSFGLLTHDLGSFLALRFFSQRFIARLPI